MSISNNDDELPVSAIMYELKQINEALVDLKETQKTILNELGGNGRPGIRTRLYSLETGYQHVTERLRALEVKDDALEQKFDSKCREYDKALHEQDNQIVAMRNIGVGISIALSIAAALSWIVPLFQTP